MTGDQPVVAHISHTCCFTTQTLPPPRATTLTSPPFLHCLSTTEALHHLHSQAVIHHHAHGRPSGARTPRGSRAWHCPDTGHHWHTFRCPLKHITSLVADNTWFAGSVSAAGQMGETRRCGRREGTAHVTPAPSLPHSARHAQRYRNNSPLFSRHPSRHLGRPSAACWPQCFYCPSFPSRLATAIFLFARCPARSP